MVTLKCFYYSVESWAWFRVFLTFYSWIYLLVELEFCHHLSPASKSYFSIFYSRQMLTSSLSLIALSPHIFILFLSLTLHTKLLEFSRKSPNFSVAILVLRNLFWKYALYLGKFESRVWSVPGLLFNLPLIAKKCAGKEVVKFKFFVLPE